ncbi:MAG: hypothetical protein MI975_05285 [Cytophagales bacterium]|nr:hypothetical protein [Cytophagales bacterium]
MQAQKHIIDKVYFEVNTADTGLAFYIRDNVDTFLKKSLFPSIESYFNGLSGADTRFFRFDNLQVNIDCTDILDEIKLRADILKALHEQVQIATGSPSKTESKTTATIVDRTEHDLDALHYFLQTGQSPWWISKSDQFLQNEDLISESISNRKYIQSLGKLLEKKTIRQRLINQFSDEFIAGLVLGDRSAAAKVKKYFSTYALRNEFWEIIIKYALSEDLRQLQEDIKGLLKTRSKEIAHRTFEKSKTRILSDLKESMEKLSLPTDASFTEAITGIISKEIKTGVREHLSDESIVRQLKFKQAKVLSPNNLKIFIKAFILSYNTEVQNRITALSDEMRSLISKLVAKQSHVVKPDKREVKTENPAEIKFTEEIRDLKDEISIKNAGLVLLHPYLSGFFQAASLTDKSDRFIPAKKELAVHLLHYLATGKLHQPEYNLVFEKFICGFPIQSPIRKDIGIPNKLRQESENLLAAVLKHWGALKHTSPDGLREGFIQRDGKVILSEGSKYRIVVERKAQDILLDRLPWTISHVRLPWIDKLIYVEW